MGCRYAPQGLAATRGFLGIIVTACLRRGKDDTQNEIVVLPGNINRNFLGLAVTFQSVWERASPSRAVPACG